MTETWGHIEVGPVYTPMRSWQVFDWFRGMWVIADEFWSRQDDLHDLAIPVYSSEFQEWMP